MSKSVIAFLLILAIVTTNFGRCFIYAGFDMNRGYIAAELCVNKTKPKLNCKGKCYLAKKLKQEEEKEKHEEKQLQKNQIQEAVIGQIFKIAAPSGFIIKNLFTEPSFNLPERSASVFRPPQSHA